MDTYVLNYNDGTAMALELREGVAGTLMDNFVKGVKVVMINDIGALDLRDVRSIIKQKPVLNDNPSYSTEMTQEEKDYIAQQQQFEQYLKEKRDSDYEDESDFDGSDI